MKIYTKTGDKGKTSLYGGAPVSKSAPRIEAYGTVDELNAVLGCILAENTDKELAKDIVKIQHELFTLGAELATPPEKLFLPDGKSRIGKLISPKEITYLENQIDAQQETLPPLTHFILPGGGKASAMAHLARTVCRRAERNVVALASTEEVREEVLQYLNRLSDYLFSLSRVLAHANGIEETKWIPEK